MIRIVVPTAAMRQRIEPLLEEVELLEWRLGSAAPFPGPADLLVVPYMIPAAELASLEGLPIRLVQSQTLGYDGVASHLPDGLPYANAVQVHEESTAELAVGLILAMQRGIVEAVQAAGRGIWHHRRQPGLAGKNVLVLGAGGVGRELLARLEPFGCEVTVVARTARDGVETIDRLPELLPAADVVVVAIPFTDETRGLVNAEFLAAMRPGALLVNVARGPIVDTDALVDALQSGRIRAALDVTDPEPLPPDHPLWSAPGVLVTPHVGGDTDAMDDRVDRVIVEQVRRLRAGEPPANLVVPPTDSAAER